MEVLKPEQVQGRIMKTSSDVHQQPTGDWGDARCALSKAELQLVVGAARRSRHSELWPGRRVDVGCCMHPFEIHGYQRAQARGEGRVEACTCGAAAASGDGLGTEELTGASPPPCARICGRCTTGSYPSCLLCASSHFTSLLLGECTQNVR